MATPQSTWHHRASAGTVWPSVSIVRLNEKASLADNFYLSVAAHTSDRANTSLRYTRMLLGCSAMNQQQLHWNDSAWGQSWTPHAQGRHCATSAPCGQPLIKTKGWQGTFWAWWNCVVCGRQELTCGLWKIDLQVVCGGQTYKWFVKTYKWFVEGRPTSGLQKTEVYMWIVEGRLTCGLWKSHLWFVEAKLACVCGRWTYM